MPTFDEIKSRHKEKADARLKYNKDLYPASYPIDKVWENNGHFYMKIPHDENDIEITRSQFDELKEEMMND